ncbi:MAG TPA: hypothetical protein VMU29_08820 [Smithella sp.]|nr:hypothetical protein [Smithella sp.]
MKRLLLFVFVSIFTFSVAIAAAQNSPAAKPEASPEASHTVKIKKSAKKTKVVKVKKHKKHHNIHKTEKKEPVLAQANTPASARNDDNTPDAGNQCSEATVIAAVKESSALKSWQNIFDSYRKFLQCDDGAIAEGYSDSITILLANNWEALKDLKTLTETDKEFLKFVLKHIDTTVNPDDVKKISNNASQNCAANFSELCSLIKERADETLKELNN